MFDIDVKFLVGGRPVSFDAFVHSILVEVARRVRPEIQNLPRAQPVVQQGPWHASEDDGERGRLRPLAVGVSEAGKLLGLSPWTIRRYIAEGQIRSVRVGRRVLVPMEVLEKVMVEGVGRR